jgi:hypothetical protein
MAVCKSSTNMLDMAKDCKPPEGMFRKTRMCKFQLHGSCTAGASCRFAHQPSELQTQPNLRKTQLCMAFERSGVCRDGQACKYAHGEQELRGPAAKQSEQILTAGQMPALQSAMQLPGSDKINEELGNSSCIKGSLLEDFDSDAWSRQTTEDASDAESLSSFSRQTTDCSDTCDDGRSDDLGDRSTSDFDCEAYGSDSSQPSLPDQLPLKGCEIPIAKKVPEAAFRKTKLCKFYSNGFCSKGASCSFAHEEGTLAPQPDLFRTRLCFAFARSGVCRDGDACKYAHGAEQLRCDLSRGRLHAIESRAAGDNSNLDKVANAEQAVSAPPQHLRDTFNVKPTTLPPIATDLDFAIKNTFVQVAVPRSPKPLRRSRSAECLAFGRHSTCSTF